MSKDELETYYIYLAGIFDGEGCVSIVRDKKKNRGPHPVYYLTAQLSMQNRYPLEIMQKVFDLGEIRYTRTMWRIVLKATRAYTFLEAIFPYLTIKKDQARLGMNFHRLKGSPWTLDDYDLNFREAFYHHMKFLKTQQKHPTPDPRPQHDYSWVKVPKVQHA